MQARHGAAYMTSCLRCGSVGFGRPLRSTSRSNDATGADNFAHSPSAVAPCIAASRSCVVASRSAAKPVEQGAIKSPSGSGEHRHPHAVSLPHAHREAASEAARRSEIEVRQQPFVIARVARSCSVKGHLSILP